ncbi:MAG: flagellar motor protein MotB [Desulfobacterales bacterium]|jgi:chemotaxis protein MotB
MVPTEWEALKKRLELSEQKRAFLQKRLMQSGVEEDSTLWSFVDLITLLLILFILFYSHAVTHKASEKNMSDVQPQQSVAQPSRVQETSIASESAAYRPYEPKHDTFETEGEKQDESLEQLRQQILQAVSNKYKNDLSIHWHQRRLILVLGERITFNVGNADLLSNFQPTLKRIAQFIASQKGYKVAIAGHTDNAPINTTQFPSNWELSTARAVNVAKFLISHGVSPHRVSIEGYSAYRPLYANTTSHNKQANRRVEISLIKEHENETASNL